MTINKYIVYRGKTSLICLNLSEPTNFIMTLYEPKCRDNQIKSLEF